MKTILLTGAAGFVGYKTAELLLARGYRVVGVDNMNDYYDARLKEYRRDLLAGRERWSFHGTDIENLASMRKIFAETKFDIPFEELPREYPMGNLIADSLLWYANKHVYDEKDPGTEVVAAVESSGIIRDYLSRGKTGRLAVCDIFRTFPLGMGFSTADDAMGYPVVTMYITAAEIKKALEVLTSVAPIKGNSYSLQVSGIKFTYNPRRVPFDRITGIWLGDDIKGYEQLDCSAYNRKLYRIAANIYNATFLKIIGRFTSGILTIVPKDRDGKAIDDLNGAVIDRDRNARGIQGLREWAGLMAFMKAFPDLDRDGIPDVPEYYREARGRITAEPSWCPWNLLRGGNWITWTAFALFAAFLAAVIALFLWLRRKFGSHR